MPGTFSRREWLQLAASSAAALVLPSRAQAQTSDQVGVSQQRATIEPNTPLEVIRLAPDPYWPKDGRVNLESLCDEQTFFLGNRSVDYGQPMDLASSSITAH
jgi:hypothetical protein